MSKNMLSVVDRRGNPVPEYKTWKIIKLGTHKATSLRGALETAKFPVSDFAASMLFKISVSDTVVDLELVYVTVKELGFSKDATQKQIFERAFERGLAPCPAEVGPQLRLQYADQPAGQFLSIGMEPTTGSKGSLNVFSLHHDDDGLRFDADWYHPDTRWSQMNPWVFVRRK